LRLLLRVIPLCVTLPTIVADPIIVITAVPWWHVVIEATVAVGTIGAALVALFGEAFRAKFFPPRLTIQLADVLGEAARVSIPSPGGGAPSVGDARFYHLRVRNTRPWSPARDVRVVVLRVEEPGPDGRLQIRWTGDIPLGWRHGNVLPFLRVVGPDTYADLCSVVRGKWLQLLMLIVPSVLELPKSEATNMVVSVQAQATETTSNILRVRISWDGGFDTGAQEMRRHTTVEEVD